MTASPEFSRAPLELVLRPIITAKPAEDHGITRLPVNGDHGDGEEYCVTPTSEEFKLPVAPRSCPPAPRKPRRVIRCKRRLSELEFFVVQPEEIEKLFRRRDDHSSAAVSLTSSTHFAKKTKIGA